MPQGMPEVKQTPVPLFEFVFLNDRRFDHHITADEFRQSGLILLVERRFVFLQFPEQGGIPDTGMFDDLRKAIGPFFFRQGLQQGHVIQEKIGLTDRSYQVLVDAHVDPVLPTDRGIDHGQYGSRHKSKGQAPHLNTSGITGDIRYYAPPYSNQESFPVSPETDELFDNGIDGVLHFKSLACLDHDRIPASEFLLVMAENIFVRKKYSLLFIDQLFQVGEPGIEIIRSRLP